MLAFFKKVLVLILVSIPSLLLAASSQLVVDDLASNLQVRIEVLENTGILSDPTLLHTCKYGLNPVDGGAEWASCSTARITLTYTGNLPAGSFGTDWAIYLSMIRSVVAVTNNSDLIVENVNGDLKRITPNPNFQGFTTGQPVVIDLLLEYWSLFKTDFMPRYYVAVDADPGIVPKVVSSTDTENVSAFSKPILANNPDNWKRSGGDNNIVQTAATRFATYNAVSLLDKSGVDATITPTPRFSNVKGGKVNLSKGVTALLGGVSYGTKQAFINQLQVLGVKHNYRYRHPIRTQVNRWKVKQLGPEYDRSGAYILKVTRKGTIIFGYDSDGVFNGLQSFLSLIPADFESNPYLAKIYVKDSPRFDYRAVHIDVARNFHSQQVVLRLIEQMAAFKLNKLHLHLSDDEGWRLEIPGLPELTDVGANRCHDLTETNCIQPALGSGPDTNNNGSGFFSVSDYVDILRHAKNHHIEVIPEFDMPGHARAAVSSMKARAKRLLALNQPEAANQYRLDDPDDTSNYTSVQFFKDSYVNPCLESTYTFIDKVVSEVKAMHEAAGLPLRIYHVGADESKNIKLGGGFEDVNEPNSVPWRGVIDKSLQDVPGARSPACLALMAQTGMQVEELEKYFLTRVSEIVDDNDIEGISGWGDGMNSFAHASEVETDLAYTNEWGTLYWGSNSVTNAFLAKNFKVILSQPDFLYFDFPYEVDPEESGYYWATRATDTRKVFSFAPQNLPQNVETAVDRDGNKWSDSSQGDATLNGGAIGMSGQLWSETIRTDDQLEYMAYPRILALAERAWHKGEWELNYVQDRVFDSTTSYVDQTALANDWNHFANVMGQKIMGKLDKAGVKYRIPIPGAVLQGGVLAANVAFPGLYVQYRDTVGGTWKTYDPQNPPAYALEVRGVSADGTRFGRAVPVE